jgi:hypothetical protein
MSASATENEAITNRKLFIRASWVMGVSSLPGA